MHSYQSITQNTAHQQHLEYRPDIDGLRAIAVLSVIVFHAFPNILKGGFVGVDIFFVISGFLITSILIKDLLQGVFSIRTFYIRRIRRIFPALILVLAFCYIFGWFALYQNEFIELAKHIAAGAAFISNFALWQESGYFDKVAETKPLLHLWSLGVEEQYYIVWPVLLCVFWRAHFRFLALIGCIAGISLIAGVYLSHIDMVQAFYAPWTRFWELLAGGILAYLNVKKLSLLESRAAILDKPFDTEKYWLIRKLGSLGINNIKSLIGGLLIAFSVFALSRGMKFPGWWALFPVAGACLIIAAGPRAWLNKFVLSHPMLVWVGLISYPLYLWHWPLLSFAQVMESKLPSLTVRFVAVIAAFTLAWGTYYFVERPIRGGKNTQIKVFSLIFFMLAIALLSIDTYLKAPAPAPVVNTTTATTSLIYTSCAFEGKAKSYCLTLAPDRPVDSVLIGDSHAGHLMPGFMDIYSAENRNLAIQWGGDCLPFFQDPEKKTFSSVCDQHLINHALLLAKESFSVRTVILSSYAIAKIQQRAESMNRAEGYVNNPSPQAVKTNASKFRQAMFDTFQNLGAAGKEVIYLVDVPELYFDPQECFSRPLELPGHKARFPCAISRHDFESRNSEYHQLITEARLAFPNIKFIDTYKHLCDEKLCYAIMNNELLYKDRDHLSAAGSRYLAQKIAKEIFNNVQ